MNPKEIIKQIAKEKRCQFDSGNDLRNALRVIVDKLNSQETHFLLELIQNADDALKGIEAGNPCKLSFFLKQDRLIVQNTGRPFNGNDVRDLSSVGDSHKDPDQIGHFGIGFKSVFRISNYPEIHSGGFSFRYNAEDETWIVPEWLGTPSEGNNNAPTTFILPFKEPERHFELLKKQINQLDPRILLFLNHLRCIESDRLLLTRQDLGNGTCLLTRNDEHSTWKIYGAELRVPPKLLEELRRLRGEKAAKKKKERIVIAIKLEENDKNIDLQRKGRIFAFLPTRHELQFPFDLHADFEVNAERTAIVDPERGWNRWIFGKVWSTFLPFFEDCKKGMLNIADFYGVLPNSEDIRNTAEEIKPVLQVMKSKIDSVFASYKTAQTINKGWYRPKEVVLTDTEFASLFHDSLPLNEDKKPLHYTLTDLPGRSKKFLGDHVQPLNEKHVISILERLGGQNRLLDWHEHLLIWLANFKDNLKCGKESFFEKLKNMPILPTISGIIAASQNGEIRVFRLPKDEKSVPIELFEEQCRFLDVNFAERFIESKDMGDRSQGLARELLKKLSPDISPQKLYDDFISPIFKEENWHNIPEDRLLKLTKFVKDHFTSIKKPKVKLKNLLGKFVEPGELYLTSSFDSNCLFEKLIDAKDRLTPEDYLKIDNEQKQWRDFLINIGVNQIPKVFEQEPVEISKKDLELRLKGSPQKSNTGYKEIQYEFDPAIRLVFEENNANYSQKHVERAKILLELINKNWDSYYKDKIDAYYQFHTKGAREWTKERLDQSKFARWLLEARWIPTKTDKLCTSIEIAKNEERSAVSLSPSFHEFLFKNAINLNTLCEQLSELVDKRVTSSKEYYELYKQIYQVWRKAEEEEQYRIIGLFREKPLIFIDKPQPQWLKPNETVWQSPKQLPFLALNKIYDSNCKAWFVDIFGVPEKPTPKHLIEFASNNIWNKDLETNTRSIWRKILSKLEEILDESPDKFSEIENLAWLKRNLKFFCFKHGWVLAYESLFYNDNRTLTGNEEFTIEMKIIQPLGEEPLFPVLYEALGIQSISTARLMPDINEPENIPKEETEKGKIHKEIFHPIRPASCSPEMASLNCCDWKPKDELSTVKDLSILGKKQGISGSNISDAERRSIGDWGEEFVMHYEKRRLKECGQQHLAAKVEWKSKWPNRYHPFDVLSFDCDKNGNWNPIEIEVKSTPYPSGNTGILSNEQWEYAKEHADKHHLYIVYSAKSDKASVRRLKFGEWAITPYTYNIIC